MTNDKEQKPQGGLSLFHKGMVKDMADTFSTEGTWSHARNAVNATHAGEQGYLGNEPANLHCVDLPFDTIGAIRIGSGRWALFLTDDVDSEIGIFDEGACTYTRVVRDRGLNFRRSHLVTGASRRRFDCAIPVYWADGRNPDRFMDLDAPPMKVRRVRQGECFVEESTGELDVETLRLAPLVDAPCLSLKKGAGSGTLQNGSYQVTAAYSVDGIRVTDYFLPTGPVGVFSHADLSGSLEVSVLSADGRFDEMEVVVVSMIDGQTTARRLGHYSTRQKKIYIDTVAPSLPTVPLNLISLRSLPYERSDAMFKAGSYLLRSGIYSRLIPNYQPLANKIRASWVAVKYPSDYYRQDGSHVGYLRDEQYAFFIRWVYNTGEKSPSYHIPGRAPRSSDTEYVFGPDALEDNPRRWQVQNTASVRSFSGASLPDGGLVVGEGDMGYWESTERYPDNQPEVWGDLCGRPIRHHKFPDGTLSSSTAHFSDDGTRIIVLGVRFDNIEYPLDGEGKPIPGIAGYEILRGSREGQKSIIAKGMLQNMREYTPEGGGGGTKGLYQNYPFNDLRPDYFHTENREILDRAPVRESHDAPLSRYRKDIFSFHSPETSFARPFLSAGELKVYGEVSGNANGYFQSVYKHPRLKFPTNTSSLIADVISLISSLDSFLGNAPQDLLRTTGTDRLPVSINLTPQKPERKQTLVGSLLGGLANVIAPGSGALVNSVVNDAAYAIGMVAYTANLIKVTAITAAVTKEQLISIVYGLIPARQFAVQYNAHGFYDTFRTEGARRLRVKDAAYVGNHVQGFGATYRVNNHSRAPFVCVELDGELTDPLTQDRSRNRMSDAATALNQVVSTPISGHYGALKVSLPAQYGQLESILQVPIHSCVQPASPDAAARTEILFGGDTYIGRFTEKNPFLLFTDWLLGQPDEFEYDYRQYINIPYPRYWVDSTRPDAEIFQLASRFRHLNAQRSGTFFVRSGAFYISVNGVRDFLVESEVNLAQRDWEDDPSGRHYDEGSYTDTAMMFRSDVIRSRNLYKYDYSLSAGKLYHNYFSWGELNPRSYDPRTAATCYTYNPRRTLYSLPQEEENRRDNWKVFLVNNYKDFSSRIIQVKEVNKTGALILFESESPQQFMGVDQLQTDAGTKLTIGDGGLFEQPLQQVMPSDAEFRYGSCQSRRSVISTPHGVFWVSQSSGKVFQYAGSAREISRGGMKWWFSRYLPSRLLEAYPDYPFRDNPVRGVGVQVSYDNTHETLYITKRDYKPLRRDLQLDENGFYSLKPQTILVPGDPVYSCPDGYVFQNGSCVKVETIDAIVSSNSVQVTRTPYFVYGNQGTRIYTSANRQGSFTLLSTGNPFWIRQNIPDFNTLTPAQKQAADLNNGPVNRLAIWGVQADGTPLNNYDVGSGSLPPVGQWIGFDVCVNIAETKVYYVAIAGDNRWRVLLDGGLIVEDQTTSTAAFNFLHVFPVQIEAGNHILRLEGYNDGLLAGFGCEVYDLNSLPGGVDVVTYLNAQTDYSDLGSRVIFTTRGVTQFTSNLFSCPVGYGLTNPSCTQPVCQRTLVLAPTVTIPQVPTVVMIKEYHSLDGPLFEDASWTISYDPKAAGGQGAWVSFHDWKPQLLLHGEKHFLSISGKGVWKHNQRTDLFCNFYGKDYPFEVEHVVSTGVQTATIRSVEYYLEAYRYRGDDRTHLLDEGFDRAVLYNSEQCSGMLRLKAKEKNDPAALLTYPRVDGDGIDIQYSKEEQKYRFNQFWDVTRDRGEFSGAEEPLMLQDENGYTRRLNPAAINYRKNPLERKKLRHHASRLWLRRLRSGSIQLLLKITSLKLQPSQR